MKYFLYLAKYFYPFKLGGNEPLGNKNKKDANLITKEMIEMLVSWMKNFLWNFLQRGAADENKW